MSKRKINRLIIGAAAVSACLSGISCSNRPSTSTENAAEREEQLMIVGTYTDAESRGIYTFRFNQLTAEWQPLDSTEVSNPSFIAIDSQRSLLYAVSENGDESDALNLLTIQPATGAMTLKGSWLTEGAAPCYVSAAEGMAVTANYTGGSLSLFPLDAAGCPMPLDTLFRGDATGNNPMRQATPHVHCAHFSPDGRFLFATDFSSDRLLRFRVQNEAGQRLESPEVAATIESGSGPRHLTFAPDRRHLYLISELSGMIHAFAYQPEDGTLTLKQTIETDSVHAQGSAHIQLSSDGRYLYASNRLAHEGVAIYAVNPDDGQLTSIGYQLTGRHPRHFNLTPNGRYLLVACRDSHQIEIYQRDPSTGHLTATGKAIPLSKPVFIGWF